jgi:hypothetical protein
MSTNLTKTQQLFQALPAPLVAKYNPHWRALIEAIGQADDKTAALVELIKNQFFVKSAFGEYLDNLGRNVGVTRPAAIGLSDAQFRKYIPALSYHPKEVRQIINTVLNFFFAKDTTTAFVMSLGFEKYNLPSNSYLVYIVDGNKEERITFKTSDFQNISQATAAEVARAINQQAKHSFAIPFIDSLSKKTFVQLFTNTIGSLGSIQVLGGTANAILKFNGFNLNAGNGSNTQWTVTKIGDLVRFQWTGGANPSLSNIRAGDIVTINLPNNSGIFNIEKVDFSTNSFYFRNILGFPTVVAQTNENQVKFVTPFKGVVYIRDVFAATSQTSPGEITVALPATPAVIKNSLVGTAHLNGITGVLQTRNSATSATLNNAFLWPLAGSFRIVALNQLKTRIITPNLNVVFDVDMKTPYDASSQIYTYSSRAEVTTTGNTTSGSNIITNVPNTTNIVPGQQVFCAAFPYWTTVVSTTVNTITVNEKATTSLSNTSVILGGNTLTGISPNLPPLSSLNEFTLSSLVRNSNIVTGTTVTPHNYLAGETVSITGSSGILSLTTTGDTTIFSQQLLNVASVTGVSVGQIVSGPGIPTGSLVTAISGTGPYNVTISAPATASATGVTISFYQNLNGTFPIISVTPTTFTYALSGANGSATTPGDSRVERQGLAPSGSIFILSESLLSKDTRIKGNYIFDAGAAFILSAKSSELLTNILPGTTNRLIKLNSTADFNSTGGFFVIDFGSNKQEGPIKYIGIASSLELLIDPSYVFKFKHLSGAKVRALRSIGSIKPRVDGADMAPYIFDPARVRREAQEIIRKVKAAGQFVDFLIRYPQPLYSAFDIYGERASEQN